MPVTTERTIFRIYNNPSETCVSLSETVIRDDSPSMFLSVMLPRTLIVLEFI